MDAINTDGIGLGYYDHVLTAEKLFYFPLHLVYTCIAFIGRKKMLLCTVKNVILRLLPFVGQVPFCKLLTSDLKLKGILLKQIQFSFSFWCNIFNCIELLGYVEEMQT